MKRFLAAVAEPNIESLREIDLPVTDLYNSHWSTTGESTPDHLSDDREVYLPGRNLMLLAKTSLYCALNEIPSVALGTPCQEIRLRTAHRSFFPGLERWPVWPLGFSFTVETPFAKLTKADVIRLGRHLPLELSFSCIRPVGLNIVDPATSVRNGADRFRRPDVQDKTRYESSASTWLRVAQNRVHGTFIVRLPE